MAPFAEIFDMVDYLEFDNALLRVKQDSKIVILYCDFDKVVECSGKYSLYSQMLVHRKPDRFYFPLPAVADMAQSLHQPMPILSRPEIYMKDILHIFLYTCKKYCMIKYLR